MDFAVEDALQGVRAVASPVHVHGAQLPLSMVHEGQRVHVARVRGGEDFSKHLATLGFVADAEVQVVSGSGDGNVIVKVKGSQLGLNRETSSRIVTY